MWIDEGDWGGAFEFGAMGLLGEEDGGDAVHDRLDSVELSDYFGGSRRAGGLRGFEKE